MKTGAFAGMVERCSQKAVEAETDQDANGERTDTELHES